MLALAAWPAALAACRGEVSTGTVGEGSFDASRIPEPPARLVRAVPIAGTVSVPAKFLGMHLHRWPNGGSPAPTFPFGTVRSLNYDPNSAGGGVHWNSIERSDGVFDWTLLDGWVGTHVKAGRDLMYTLYGTPAWCASGTKPDPYGKPGGDTPPRDLRFVGRFVRALLERYNAGGVRRIQYVEIWNEPTFDGKQVWKGTAEDLAALGRAVYLAAKATDAGVKVLWPAFIDSLEAGVRVPNLYKYTHQAYANASDGAGGHGRDWADALNFHYYFGDRRHPVGNLMDHEDSMLAVRRWLERPDWAIHLSEMGFLDGVGERYPTDRKIALIHRWVMTSAAYGNRTCNLYSYESETNLGAPAVNRSISQAIAEIHERIVGRRIVKAGLLADDTFWVAFDDGSTLRR